MQLWEKDKNCNAISNMIMEWVLRRWKYIYNFCVYFSGYCASKRCKHHWTCCLSNYHDIKERPQNCVTNQGEYTSYIYSLKLLPIFSINCPKQKFLGQKRDGNMMYLIRNVQTHYSLSVTWRTAAQHGTQGSLIMVIMSYHINTNPRR